MKKLLIAICLLLVFGITSAAISFGRSSFDSSGSGGASGGSPDVAMGTRGVRGSSSDGGSFAPQGPGGAASYMLSGGHGDGSLTTRTGGDGYSGQGNDLSFEGWLQKYAEPFAHGFGPGAHSDSVGDGSSHGYSPESPVARFEGLRAAGPGSSSSGSPSKEIVSLQENIAAVPEPETYALLLAGLCLVGVVARRRKAGQS